jgi:hypothetical protein
MSYTLSVPAAKPPALDRILDQMNQPDAIIVNERLVSKWPNTTLMLCHRQRSTRGVYLSYVDGQIEVKTNAFCSQEDYQLALRLTVVVAEETGSLPRGEYSGATSANELLISHNEEWIEAQQNSALRTTKVLVKERGPMSMPGPFRACYIGPRILEQVGHLNDAEAIEEILNIMRRVQWIHTAGYKAASDLLIGDTKQHLAIWFPMERMFLPKVQWINIADTEPLIVIPFERLPDVLGKPLTLIDEHQPVIEPATPEELPDLVARARPFHSSPAKADSLSTVTAPSATASKQGSLAKSSQRPWWKFW